MPRPYKKPMNPDMPIAEHVRRRKSIRLKEYDYSLEGAYFVTICTYNREHLFGEIISEAMRVNKYGTIIRDCWNGLIKHYPNIELDQFVVMPNHVHGIVIILDEPIVGSRHASTGTIGTDLSDVNAVRARHTSPLQKNRNTLGNLIGSFKSAATKLINEIRHTSGTPIWQRGYFEHIIRNEKSLTRIREYIYTNPQRWDFDRENPSAKQSDEFETWIKSFRKASLS